MHYANPIIGLLPQNLTFMLEYGIMIIERSGWDSTRPTARGGIICVIQRLLLQIWLISRPIDLAY